MSRLLVMIGALLLGPVSAAAQAPPARDRVYTTDEAGRSFRVGFPLHDRVWLRGGYEFGAEPTPLVEIGWSFKLNVDFPDEEIWWQLRHQLLRAELRAASDSPWTITALSADYLRHDVSSSILIPRNKRDIRLPAPFDIAVVWSLLTLRLAPRSSDTVRGAEIAELAVLADFVRDETYRHRLAIGAAASYVAERDERTARWRHEIVPFSGLTALWGWEHRSGRFSAAVTPMVARAAMLSAGDQIAWAWRASAEAEIEWVVVAVNDAPISLLARTELSTQVGAATHWNAGLGARLAIPSGF